jgi:type IV secretory pathway VirD2 relaxase
MGLKGRNCHSRMLGILKNLVKVNYGGYTEEFKKYFFHNKKVIL